MTGWSFSGSLKDRIETLESFLDDHLAFRQSVISAVLRANLLLGESPHPLVASGFDGWLFYITGSEDLRRGNGLEEDQLRDSGRERRQQAHQGAEPGHPRAERG